MNRPLKIAHISDLHFSKITFHPSQFLSKRWLGTINLVFSRQKDYLNDRPYTLLETFKQLEITDIVITGDLSTTSSKSEFSLALAFVNRLKDEGFRVYAIPGNHDHYTKKAYRNKAFYRFFDYHFEKSSDPIYHFNLKDHSVAARELNPGIWLLALDTALATGLYFSTGYFSPKIEENLMKLLKLIPHDDKILMVNHFPFFQQEIPRKRLIRAPALKSLIEKHKNILFYLHGHTHRHSIADLRTNGLPIVLDSGSVSHRSNGSWNLIELKDSDVQFTPYFWNNEKACWAKK